jgi:hypothetical protein
LAHRIRKRFNAHEILGAGYHQHVHEHRHAHHH